MSGCGKYSDWLTEAGVGGLAPHHERELLAHAAECDACREAYRHARELGEIVDRGVESLVSGEPSPHFAARLRARIAEEPTSSWRTWLGLYSGVSASRRLFSFQGAVAAVGILVVLLTLGFHWLPPNHPVGPTVAGKQNEKAPDSPRAPNPGAPIVESVQPVSRLHHGARLLASRSQPEVLVPPGQLDAVVQFAEAIRSGRVDTKQLLAAQQEAEKPLEIEPIEIAPLAPPESDVALAPATNDGRP